MGINFPASPTLNQKYPQPAVAGIPVYTWDGEKWTTVGGSIAAYAPPADAVPLANAGAGAVGVATEYAREDHVHPFSAPGNNAVINGDFRVNQGGYVSAAALVTGAYGHDQWKAGASGGDYSFTQLNSSTQITIASGKSLIQPIEDVSVVGGSYTLSWTGTAQARAGVNSLTPSGAYAASPLLIAGQTAGTVMSVEFNSGTLGTVKLESGASATPFIMRPYDQELAICQRYYRKTDGLSEWGVFGYALTNTHTLGYTVPYPVPMRAAPTITTGGLWSGSNTSNVAPNIQSADKSGYFAYIAASAGGQVIFYPNGSGIMYFDARL